MKEIFRLFNTGCNYLSSRLFGKGVIHNTYLIDSKEGKLFILQEINSLVFRNPIQLMKNTIFISEHLKKKQKTNAPGWVFPVFYSSHSGDYLVESEDGKYWRLMDYIESDPVPVSNDRIYEIAGSAFGQYIKLLSDFDASLIKDSIPNFHNFDFRIEKFKNILETGERNLQNSADIEIRYLLSVEERFLELQRMENRGQFPVRLTHKDTKIDNILFDHLGNPKAIIDLDTTMQGIVHSDFGDAIRSFGNSASEDERDLEKVSFRLDVFRKYATGFIKSLRGVLSKTEKDSLYLSPCAWTYMQAVRFLTDYLEGSVYYRTEYPEHNLVRARNQIHLLKDMDRNIEKQREIIKEILKKYTH